MCLRRFKSGLYGWISDLWRCSEESRRSIGVKAPYSGFKAGAAIIDGEVVIPAADALRRIIPMKRTWEFEMMYLLIITCVGCGDIFASLVPFKIAT
jgi:hypothetical protein